MAININAIAAFAGFEAGSVLEKPEDILAYVTAMYLADADDPAATFPAIDADALVSMIEDVQDANAGASDEDFEIALIEAIDAYDGEAGKPEDMGENLSTLLTKADEDKAISGVLTDTYESADKVARSPLVLAMRLMVLYPPAERALFPIPQSDSGNNPDMVETTYQKTNGETGTRKVSRIRTWVYAHHIIADLIEEKTRATADKQGNKITPEQRRQEKNWQNRIAAAAKALTNAIRIFQTFDALAGSKLIAADISTIEERDANGKKVSILAPGTYPITVSNKVQGKAAEVATFTPASFAKLVNRASATVTWAEFTNKGKRSPRAGKLAKIDAKNFGLAIKSLTHVLGGPDGFSKINKMLLGNSSEALEAGSSLLVLEGLLADLLPDVQRARFMTHLKALRKAA